MAKRILYKVHCTPQEQVSSGGRYYLDGDCGRKLTGSLTATAAIGTTIDFIAVTATSITSDATVHISLDNNSTIPIKLLEGECFASKIASGAEPYVRITNNSGSASVDYMTGT